jgi:hypothetical protein
MNDVVTICSAFGVPGSTELIVEELEQQRQAVRFLAGIVNSPRGPLRGPYRDALNVGEMFGATAECGLHLPTCILCAFVGAYGAVTSCEDVAGVGALVTAEDATLLVDKIILEPGTSDEVLSGPRAASAQRLRAVGCKAISNHLDERTRRRDRDP